MSAQESNDPTAPSPTDDDHDVFGLEMLSPLGSLFAGLSAGVGPQAGSTTASPSGPAKGENTVKLPRP